MSECSAQLASHATHQTHQTVRPHGHDNTAFRRISEAKLSFPPFYSHTHTPFVMMMSTMCEYANLLRFPMVGRVGRHSYIRQSNDTFCAYARVCIVLLCRSTRLENHGPYACTIVQVSHTDEHRPLRLTVCVGGFSVRTFLWQTI